MRAVHGCVLCRQHDSLALEQRAAPIRLRHLPPLRGGRKCQAAQLGKIRNCRSLLFLAPAARRKEMPGGATWKDSKLQVFAVPSPAARRKEMPGGATWKDSKLQVFAVPSPRCAEEGNARRATWKIRNCRPLLFLPLRSGGRCRRRMGANPGQVVSRS